MRSAIPLDDEQTRPARRGARHRRRARGRGQGRSSTRPCSAGIVARVGDTVIDGTVRHRLEQLKGDLDSEAMAELTINADEIAAALRQHVETFAPSPRAGAGRARARGRRRHRPRRRLPETAVNELLEFEGGTLGLALNLDEDSIGAVVLGEADEVEEGHAVKATGRILSVPVGDALDRPRGQRARPGRSTARARSRPPRSAASRCRRPASSAASRCTSRCRPASRPSTP